MVETGLGYLGLCGLSVVVWRWLAASDGGFVPVACAVAVALAHGLWLNRVYAVGHEAVHAKLFPQSRWLNDLVGAVVLAPLCAPLTVYRKIHAFHHSHNRRAPRVATLDVVVLPPGPPWWRVVVRTWGWLTWLLAVFAGGFFLHSLVSVVLFLLLPISLARRVSPAFHGWRPRLRARAFAELLLGFGLHFSVWQFAGPTVWLATLAVPLLAFAWVWSMLLYIYHYDTPIGEDVRGNVRALRPSRLWTWLLLNFNEHTTHHRDPSLPWYRLPH